MQFAVNYPAPFLLTRLLPDVLIASVPARIVNVSAVYDEKSPPINFDDLQSEREPYDKGVSGKYFDNQKAVPSSQASYDEIAASRLWMLSEDISRFSAFP
jgi:NAD(P)-dependent dehydrogenase (short-subunit alcohol dehydrogenase family)